MHDLGEATDTVGQQARWWLDFRRTNDWLSLWDWPQPEFEVSELPAGIQSLRESIMNENLEIEKRKKAALDLADDPVGARVILSLASENQLPQFIKEALAEPMLRHPDMEIRNVSMEFFESSENSGYSSKQIAEFQGNVNFGKSIFNTKCLSCHMVQPQASSIGPNLSHIGSKFDKTGMVDAIVNPNASVAFGYQQTMVKAKNGRVYTGFLVSRNKETIILRDFGGKQQVIPVDQIDSEQTLQNSLMPDPQYLGMEPQAVADVAEYLLTLK